jgi:hypothetical protein
MVAAVMAAAHMDDDADGGVSRRGRHGYEKRDGEKRGENGFHWQFPSLIRIRPASDYAGTIDWNA